MIESSSCLFCFIVIRESNYPDVSETDGDHEGERRYYRKLSNHLDILNQAIPGSKDQGV
jgi:hypothetical protein